VGLGLAVMAAIAPLVLAFGEEIAAFYTGDEAVIALAAPALALVAGFLFADASQGILIGALRGAGDVRIPLAIQVIAYLGIAIPLGYGLGFTAELGIQGLILGLFAGLSAASALLAWRFVVLVRGPIAAV
jgi:MATE family multidrug resistance protein